MLKAQNGGTDPKILLAKYPLGYVIFDVDYADSVFPYSTHALDNWDFTWSTVHLTEKSPEELVVTMPDIKGKGNGGSIIKSMTLRTPKKVGPFGGKVGIFSDGIIAMKGEILAIGPKGVVFLLGFVHVN